jgi:hypothetical protein
VENEICTSDILARDEAEMLYYNLVQKENTQPVVKFVDILEQGDISAGKLLALLCSIPNGVLLIMSKDSQKFGAFGSTSWKGGSKRFGDSNSFLF